MSDGVPFSSEATGDGRLRLSGTLTLESATRALSESEDWPESVRTIDLSGIERSDSAGVALLLEWWRQARRRGADISYTHAPAQMRAIIEVSGLGGILPLAEPDDD